MHIILNDKIGVNNKKVDNYVGVDLERESKLLQGSDMSTTLDEFKQYLKESDESKKYRLTFIIKPICSNVLFNMLSEIVHNEGDESCKVYGLNGGVVDDKEYLQQKFGTTATTLTRAQAIADTGFSHKYCGNLVYHCGLDIFNNHNLRRNKFVIVNKLENGTTNPNFNTIKDILRDKNGEQVESEHLYTIDELYGFNQAIEENLVERDGWFGFHNPTTLEIPNVILSSGTEVSLNKCMNNNKANEFIDMYPDRSLFSFIPKYNKYRNRYEKNWEYCLTYPAESDSNHPLVSFRGVNSLGCVYMDGMDNYTFKSQVSHNLQVNDRIHLYMYKGDTSIDIRENFRIKSVGDGKFDKNLYFTINPDDIKPYILTGTTMGDYTFRYVKAVNGANCQYYFRKFKPLPNYAMADVDTNSEISEEDKSKCSRIPFRNVSGKLGFAKTSYGDDVMEIVFTDDININSLKDNLGREMSEIYLTIVKTNYGHKEWYENNNHSGSTIEFSHCFGKVTSALDLDSKEDDYNIHRIHNIPSGLTPYISQSPLFIEDDITIKGSNGNITGETMFLGDLVEFSPYTIEETVLEDVYHRFNTVQREIVNDEFSGFTYTEITDDGEGPNNGIFTAVERDLIVSDTTGSSATSVAGLDLTVYRANLFPEGYFYKPHHKVQLYRYNTDIQQGEDVRMIFTTDSLVMSGNRFKIFTAQNYYLNVGDTIMTYTYPTRDLINAQVMSVTGQFFNEIILKFDSSVTVTNLDKYLLYKPNPLCPDTAYRLHDGSGRYIWREKMTTSDVLVEEGAAMNIFTNGAHYINTDINFYLKRQDPNGYFNLTDNGQPTSVLNVIVNGKEKDIEEYDYEVQNNENRC